MKGYLRGLEQEFEESSNAIRIELNRFESAGLLSSHDQGNKKYFGANQEHPLFNELNAIIRKYIGIDRLIERVVENAGDLHQVYLTGRLAQGLDSQLLDLVLVGNDLDKGYLTQLSERGEHLLGKKIRWVDYSPQLFKDSRGQFSELFLIWEQ